MPSNICRVKSVASCSKQPFFTATNSAFLSNSEMFYFEEFNKNTLNTSKTKSQLFGPYAVAWMSHVVVFEEMEWMSRVCKPRAAQRSLVPASGIIQGVVWKAEPSVSIQCLFFFF